MENIRRPCLTGMAMVTDTRNLKGILNGLTDAEIVVHPSLALGCGPAYFKTIYVSLRNRYPLAKLWLHCGIRSGDVLKFIDAGYPFLCTSVQENLFVKLQSMARQRGIYLERFDMSLLWTES